MGPPKWTGMNRFCSGADRLAHPLRIDVERIRLDIDEHRSSADAGDGRSRSDKRNRRDDDLIALADTERLQRHFQCHGAVHRGKAVRTVLKRGESFLELTHDGMKTAPTVAGENLFDEFALALVGYRPLRKGHKPQE